VTLSGKKVALACAFVFVMTFVVVFIVGALSDNPWMRVVLPVAFMYPIGWLTKPFTRMSNAERDEHNLLIQLELEALHQLRERIAQDATEREYMDSMH